MTRPIALVLLLVPIAFASAARAEGSRPELAPPRPCAEPRAAANAAAAVAAEAYPVAGPVSSLFDPRDVAAGPPGGGPQRPQPPTARTLVRPGPCDQPGAGCGAAVSSSVIEVPPVSPGVRPPRDSRSIR